MLYPSAIITQTAAFNFHKKKRGISLYLVVLVLFSLGVASLPFIKVDVTFQSRGQVSPTVASNTISSSLYAQVQQINFKENQDVQKGTVLLTLNTHKLEEQIKLQESKLQETKQFIADLEQLTNAQPNHLYSLAFQQEYIEYQQQLRGLQNKKSFYKKGLATAKTLFTDSVIANSEYQKKVFDFTTASNDLKNYQNSQLKLWQNKRQQYSSDTIEIHSQIEQLKKEKENYVIKAPISGTIKNYSGIKAGNFVAPNQTIAEISPNDSLIVACYVSPSDIGYLRQNMPVVFQIDAFNYNQWGLAKGKVIEIYNDVSILNEQPVFRVRCELLTHQMQLKSGFVGTIKKGMTLTGRFKVTQRTLWQLLYDKMDDWLNPKMYK